MKMHKQGHELASKLLADARAGHTDAARMLLEYLSRCINWDEAQRMPSEVGAFFVEAFHAIAEGASADETLLLKQSKGRPPNSGFWIAKEVHESELPKHKRPGGRYSEIGERHNLSASAIEAIYSKWRPTLEESDRIDPPRLDAPTTYPKN